MDRCIITIITHARWGEHVMTKCGKGTKKKKSIVKTKPMAKMPTVELPGKVTMPSGIDHEVIGL